MKPRRIAVVDDDESVRESLEGLLMSTGCSVATYVSAEDYLKVAKPGDADCLILDMRMPGMSGPELRRTLLARGVDLPVIFITAHGPEDLRPKLLEEGAVACLIKPFGEDELLAAIRSALKSVE